MSLVVSIMSQGSMGSAVAARLVAHGAEVRTMLDGRSSASADRATKAGMRPVPPEAFVAADLILSIVPPAEALPLAERLAGPLAATEMKPTYCDLNAIAPQSAAAVGERLAAAGCPFVDGGIIGGPPRKDYSGPVIYLSGPQASAARVLGEYGLNVRILDGPVGAASALKMCYGGITKGLTALGSAMILAAERSGVSEALHAEMSESHPALLRVLAHNIPAMYSRAYRWVAEMEEISGFVGGGARAEGSIYEAIAGFYRHMADDFSSSREEIELLDRYLARGGSQPPTDAAQSR